MIAQILAYISQTDVVGNDLPATSRVMLNILPCIFMFVVICFWGLVIFGLVKLIKYLGSAGREQKLIRMELSKLADEVQQIRQELKGPGESLEKETNNDE